MISQRKTVNLTLSGLMLALAFVLPYLTGNIPEFGSLLLPMHLPAFLCGFLCGPFWGMAMGFVAPILRSLTLGMPPSMVMAVPMAFELAAYAGVCGWIFYLLKEKTQISTLAATYFALVPALVLGRLVYALAKAAITLSRVDVAALAPYIFESIATALPGVAVQLTLIPVILLAVERYRRPVLQENVA